MRLILVSALLLAAACAPKVLRDPATFQAETMASLARQQEAATALLQAAIEAPDEATCAAYAEPALLIKAKAQPQAYRALWLAGLPYPTSDGSEPPDEQEDPGVGPEPDAVASVCEAD